MKKLFGLLISVVLTLSITSCSSPGSSNNNESNSDNASAVPIVAEKVTFTDSVVFKCTLDNSYLKFPERKTIRNYDAENPGDIPDTNNVLKADGNYYYYFGNPGVRKGNFSGLIGTWIFTLNNNKLEATFTKDTIVSQFYVDGNPSGDPITDSYYGSNGIYKVTSSTMGTVYFLYTNAGLYNGHPLIIVTGENIPPVFR